MKKSSKPKTNLVLPAIAAALFAVAAFSLFLFTPEENATGNVARASFGEGSAFANPSLSGAVVAIVSPATTTTAVTCSEERESSYDYDYSTGSPQLLGKSYRIVKKCSDGSETVVKDWTPEN